MIANLKETYYRIRNAEPGKRFTAYYEYRNKRSRSKSSLYISVGILLVVIGFSLSLVPGVPGILLGIPGLGMIASQFRPMARLLDRIEIISYCLLRRLRGFFPKSDDVQRQ